MKTKKDSGKIDASNFRETAQKIIAKYFEKGMLVDALLWAEVIRLYNVALDDAAYEQSMCEFEAKKV